MATGGAKNPQANIDPNFLRLQNDLKRTAFGIKFARALFTGGNGALSETFLREGFKQLGLEIPKGVELTLTTAQAIAAGSALVEQIELYDGLDDLRSVTDAGIATVKLASKVFESIGWLKKNSDEAQIIRTGVNVATLIASCGMNVQAWISLALDFTSFEALNAIKAKQIAQEDLITRVQAMVNPQAKAAADVLKAYQEKEMSTFAFVGRMAESAPDLWPQYFPQFAGWAPVREWRTWTTAEKRTWYGSSSGEQRAEYVWKSLAGYSKEQIKAFIFMNLAEPTLFPFYMANEEYANQNKCSLQTLALISTMVTGFDFINTSDLSPLLFQNQMTLSDFEQPMILKYLDELKNPHQTKRTAGIIVGGSSEYMSASEKNLEKMRTFVWDHREILEAADRMGRIDLLWRIPEMRKVMSEAMTYPAITPNRAYGIWNEASYVKRGRGGDLTTEQITMRFAGPGAGWRSPRNYFAALALIDQLRSDEYFMGWTAPPVIGLDKDGDGVFTAITSDRDIGTYDFLGTVEEFERRHRELTFKMTVRKVNTLALGNVAYYLGTTPDKLLRMNREKVGEAAVYDKKG